MPPKWLEYDAPYEPPSLEGALSARLARKRDGPQPADLEAALVSVIDDVASNLGYMLMYSCPHLCNICGLRYNHGYWTWIHSCFLPSSLKRKHDVFWQWYCYTATC